ncbi:MAG: glycosyltransferase [Planctomycetota bacterium]
MLASPGPVPGAAQAAEPKPASNLPTGLPGGLTRIDAHCHTKASDGAAVAALGLINCPECYSEPEAVYDQAMARGMDLVTITDHDTIRGAMTLVERGFERFIVGQEVSVKFPEDRCMLHVLVWGLTPDLDEQITRLNLRSDIYDFAGWLRDKGLAHAVAHPLYIQNGRLQRWHVERAALLFRSFECLNGAHAAQVSDAVVRYLDRLTPEHIDALAAEHQIEPYYDNAWRKGRTGGSDDHGLLNIGRTWTELETPEGKITDPVEFFRRAMNGETRQGGIGGHPALLAHQFATVGAHYYADKLYKNRTPTGKYIAAKLLRFAGVQVKSPSKKKVAAYKAARKIWFGGKRKPRSLPIVRALRKELAPVLDKYPELRTKLDPETWTAGAAVSEHERMAEFVQDLTAALSRSMKPSAMKALRKRDPSRLLEHLISYMMLHVAQLPYLISLFYQNKERNFLDRFEHETSEHGTGVRVLDRSMRVSLFTDTIADVNGVCRFIQNVAQRAHESGRDLEVITSTRKAAPSMPNVYNFDPVFSTNIPKYESLDISLPPLMKILRHVDQHQPDVIHISTPGPVGLCGFLAAKIHKIPVLGVYHTDFPAYIDRLFDDHGLTAMCRSFMKGFYRPFSAIFTRSDDYVDALAGLGLPREKMVSLMPGFEAERFHTRFRDESIWPIYGAKTDSVKVMYVGRVSVEKNMPFLTEAWKKLWPRLKERGVEAEFIVIGDGPYREQMEKELKGKGAHFLGFRHGDELSRLYASGDLFAFASTTDTLGQVVMESQGSGLPVIVSDQGGPKEVVQEGRTGFVLSVNSDQPWVESLEKLICDHDLRKEMGAAAHESMQPYSLEHSFEHFWEVHTDAWHDHLGEMGVTSKTRANAVTRASENGHAGTGETPGEQTGERVQVGIGAED